MKSFTTTQKTILLAGLIAMFMLVSACTEEEEPDIISNPLSETSWKLIRMEVTTNSDYENKEIIDYSNDSIIYVFTSENGLFIHNFVSTGFPDDIQESGIGDYQSPHPYKYSCQERVDDGGCPPPPPPVLSISNKVFDCNCNIDKTTDTMYIASYLGFTNENGDRIRWTKYLVRIREGGNQ
jgi:hypothetical protein